MNPTVSLMEGKNVSWGRRDRIIFFSLEAQSICFFHLFCTWQLKTQSRRIFVSVAKMKAEGIRGARTKICSLRWELSVLGQSRRKSTRHNLHSLTFTYKLVFTVRHFDLLGELQALLKKICEREEILKWKRFLFAQHQLLALFCCKYTKK